MRSLVTLSISVFATLAPALADNPAVALVGDLGDTQRLEFRGVETFSVEDVRRALTHSFEYQYWAHPAGPRDQFLFNVRELVEQGYQHSGFPQVKVEVSCDETSNKVLVTVEEGKRIRAGHVRVLGSPKIDADELIQSLTKPASKLNIRQTVEDAMNERETPESNPAEFQEDETAEPLWRPGKPVPFDLASRIRRNQRLEDVLANMGYLQAQGECCAALLPDSDVADLVVALDKVGVRSVIDEIEVEGLTRNSQQELTDYLGLKKGEFLTLALMGRLSQRLYDSGRFWHCKFVPLPLDVQQRRFRLVIRVVEYPPAPPLGAEFSQAQQLLLGLRRRLENLAQSEDDIVIRAEGELFTSGELSLESTTFIFSPSQGALLTADGNWGPQRPAKYALVMTPDQFGLYSAGRGEKYRADLFDVNTVLTVSLLPGGKGEDGQFTSSFNFSGGMTTEKEEPDAGPVSFRLIAAPVAMLREGHRDNTQVVTRDGVTKFERDDGWLAFDAKTGRFLEWVVKSPNADQRIRLTLEPGAFAKEYGGWQRELAGSLNYHHPQTPIAALVAFVSDEWIWAHGEPAPGTATVRDRLGLLSRLIDQTLLPLTRDTVSTSDEDEGDDKFRIPSNWKPAKLPDNLVGQWIVAGSRLLPGIADEVFPRRRWPWTLARETSFFINGRRTYAGRETKQLLESNEIGPLGCLAVGRVLAFVHPQAARFFGVKGRAGGLTLAEFRKDTQLLIEGDTVLARATRQLARILREAEPDEIKGAAQMLPSEAATWLLNYATVLRGEPDRPAEHILLDSLDEFWHRFLKDWTRAELEKLAEVDDQRS